MDCGYRETAMYHCLVPTLFCSPMEQVHHAYGPMSSGSRQVNISPRVLGLHLPLETFLMDSLDGRFETSTYLSNGSPHFRPPTQPKQNLTLVNVKFCTSSTADGPLAPGIGGHGDIHLRCTEIRLWNVLKYSRFAPHTRRALRPYECLR